jgi:hypothetical protein
LPCNTSHMLSERWTRKQSWFARRALEKSVPLI